VGKELWLARSPHSPLRYHRQTSAIDTSAQQRNFKNMHTHTKPGTFEQLLDVKSVVSNYLKVEKLVT